MLHKLLEHISDGQNGTDINIMVNCVSNSQLKKNNIKNTFWRSISLEEITILNLVIFKVLR